DRGGLRRVGGPLPQILRGGVRPSPQGDAVASRRRVYGAGSTVRGSSTCADCGGLQPLASQVWKTTRRPTLVSPGGVPGFMRTGPLTVASPAWTATAPVLHGPGSSRAWG